MARILVADDIDFSKYIEETEAQQKIRCASEYIDELIQLLGKEDPDPGDSLPWRDHKAASLFKFRPGEVSLWGGVNGHGKSLLSGFVAVDLIAARKRVCVASFEMKPHRTLGRMLRQFVGINPMAEWARGPGAVETLRDLYSDFASLSHETLWLFDQQGSTTSERMIAVARYCAKELRIEHLFIDSLMKCVGGEDSYNEQKRFVDELTAIARDYGMHIHLVHHIRKLESEEKIPNKFDIKGSGSISDQVDNVLLVWRNKKPERDRKENPHDAALIVCKQRNGTGREFVLPLYFDQESQQYRTEKDGGNIDFFRRSA